MLLTSTVPPALQSALQPVLHASLQLLSKQVLVMASLFNHSTPSLLTAGLSLSGLAALAYVGTCFALYSYQHKLIFRPLPNILRTPADIGLPYEDLWIPTPSGSDNAPGRLHSWWLPHPGSRRTLLYCHGNYGNISYNLERIRLFYEMGFSVFVFDYRGYGQSTPHHNTQHSSEPVPTEKSTFADVETAWQYLTTQRQVQPSDITIFGHSMGGAIAIELATHHPEAANLIVECSFTKMEDAVHAKKMYSLFPIEQLLTEPFDSISKVPSLQLPVLYVHGTIDSDVPMPFSQQLYAASPEPKQLWLVAGAGHNDIAMIDPNGYKQTVETFLADTGDNTANAIDPESDSTQSSNQLPEQSSRQRSAMSTAA